MIEVEIGDTIVEFPDDTPTDVMKSALSKRFGGGRPQAAATSTTTGQALQRGLMTGATFNFYDELAGLARAGGLDPNDPNVVNAITALGKGAYRRMVGDEEARRLYEEQAAATRAETEQLEKEHPIASTVGGVAGALAVPVGAALRAPTLAGRIAQGVGLGAGVGGLSGAGAGEGMAGRAAGAATGAAVGGAIGGAAVPATEALIRGGRALAAPVTSAIAGLRRPEEEAARRVATAIERDVAAGQAGLTPAEVAQVPPARVMDIGGENTRALARSAANLSPEARANISRAVEDRYTSQSERVSDWFRQTFNYPDAAAQSKALEETARTVNRPAYARAYREGEKQIWSPALEQLTSSPDFVAAMREAVSKGKSRAVTEGLGGFRPGVTVDQGGIVTFQKGPTGIPTYPNLQFWDYTKRALDDAGRAARRAGRTDEASVIDALSATLRTELDQAVPSYATARAGAASFFGAEDALDAGRKYLSRNMTAEDGRQALAKMTAQEKQLFQDGFVSEFIKTLEKLPDRTNVIDQINGSPAARSKLQVALGTQRTNELEALLRVETIMNRMRGALGNSTTARQLVELGLASSIGGGVTAGFSLDPRNISLGALLGAGAKFGKGKIDQRVANRIGELLTSGDPTALNRAIRMIAGNSGLMRALRFTDRQVAKISGTEGANVPAVQFGVPSAAENNQQQVPGPIQ